MSVATGTLYQCWGCDELYESRRDAQNCCEPTIVQGFRCTCGAIFETKTAATRCRHGDCVCGCPRKWHMGSEERRTLCQNCSCRGYTSADEQAA